MESVSPQSSPIQVSSPAVEANSGPIVSSSVPSAPADTSDSVVYQNNYRMSPLQNYPILSPKLPAQQSSPTPITVHNKEIKAIEQIVSELDSGNVKVGDHFMSPEEFRTKSEQQLPEADHDDDESEEYVDNHLIDKYESTSYISGNLFEQLQENAIRFLSFTKTYSRSNLLSHERIDVAVADYEPGIYRCHFCGYRTRSYEEYGTHYDLHIDYYCTMCKKRFTGIENIKEHWVKDHGQPYIDPNIAHSRLEQRNANGEVTVSKCKECKGMEFKTKAVYWEHRLTCHPKPKMTHCPKCEFVSPYKHHFEYHLARHYNNKTYSCIFRGCNYECINLSMLISHMKSHSSYRPYGCLTCGFSCKFLNSLKQHCKSKMHEPASYYDPKLKMWKSVDLEGKKRGKKINSLGHIMKQTKVENNNPALNLLGNHLQYPPNPMLSQFLPFFNPFQSAVFGAAQPYNYFNFHLDSRQYQNQLIANERGMTHREETVTETPSLYPAKEEPFQDHHISSQISQPQRISPVIQQSRSVLETTPPQEDLQKIKHYSSTNSETPVSRKMVSTNVDIPMDLTTSASCKRSGEAMDINQSFSEFSSRDVKSRRKGYPQKYFKGETDIASPEKKPQLSPYKCKFCDVSFKEEVMFVIHRGYHDRLNPFKCNLCGEITNDALGFTLHMYQAPHHMMLDTP